MSDYGTREQPLPTGSGVEVWPLVLEDVRREQRVRWHWLLARGATEADVQADEPLRLLGLLEDNMVARCHMGRERYGEALRAGNGRDALTDAYQEALDGVVYLRQAMEEAPPDADDGLLRDAYNTAHLLARQVRRLLLARNGR